MTACARRAWDVTMHHEDPSARLFHLLVRYHYLQELLEHQRVLVIGRAEAASADALDRQGIRRAVFIDSSEQRVAEARRACTSRRVEFIVGPLARVALVEDSFDVAIIEDFGKLEDRSRDLAAAKRGLTSSGVLVACIPNPDTTVALASVESATLGYYEFYGQLADSFPFVRMIGQCPLVAFALADLAVDDPEASITFDSSMLEEGSEDAEFFVALCSRSPIDADPFAVVQLPLSWIDANRLVGAHRARPTDPELQAPAPAQAAAPAAAPRAVEPAVDVDALKKELQRRDEAASQEISKLKIEIDKRAVTIAKLENHLREAREKAAIEHDRVIQTKLALEAEKKKVLSLQKEAEMGRRISKMTAGPEEEPAGADRQRAAELADARRRADELEQKVSAAVEERDRAAIEVDALRAEIEALRTELEAGGGGSAELDALEDELEAERAARRKAESRAAEFESRAKRADGLAADLGRERGARKLAESHAAELEKRLREARQQAPAAGRRLSPTEEALKKAEAAFSGASLAEQVDQLRDHLMREARAREAAEARLAELSGAGDPAVKLQEELARERDARRRVEETVITLEARLSQAEAAAARLQAEGEARRRAESAFGAAQPKPSPDVTTMIPAETLAELTSCAESRRRAEDALEAERQQRLDLETRLDACQREVEALRDVEAQLREERTLRTAAEAELADVLESHREDTSEHLVEGEEPEAGPADDETLADLERRLHEEQRLRREAEQDIESLEATRGREVDELEAALRSRGEQVASLTRELNAQAELLKRVIEDLNQAQTGDPDLSSRLERTEVELAELKRQLESSEDECGRLQAELDERTRELTELSSRLQDQEWRAAELTLEARGGAEPELGVEPPILSLTGGHAAPEAVVPDLQAELAEANRRRAALELQLRAAQDDAAASASALSEAKAKVRELHALVDNAASEQCADEAAARLQALERELETCVEVRRALELDVARLREELEAVNAKRKDAEDHRDQLEAELAEARQAAAEIDRDLAAAQACVSMLEEQIPGVSSLLKSVKVDETAEFPAPPHALMERGAGAPAAAEEGPGSELKLLREQLADAREEADRAMTRETVLQARFDERCAELEQRNAQLEELTARLADLERELASSTDRSARLMGELAQAQAVVALAQSELAELRDRLDASALEAARWTATVDQLEGRLARATAQLDEERASAAELSRDLARERADTQDLRERLTDAERLAETLGDELERLRAEARPAATATDDTIEGLQRLLSSCRQIVAEREGEIAGLRFSFGELEAAFREARAAAGRSSAAEGTSARAAAELAACQTRVAELQRVVARLEAAEASHLERIDELEASLADAHRRSGELEYIGQHAEEWAERLDAAEREGARLRAELADCQAQAAEARRRIETADAFGGELAALRDQLGQQASQIETLQQERFAAEEALERVIEGFSEVSSDAAALFEVLKDRDDLIQRLQQHLGTDRLTPREPVAVPVVEPTDTVEGCAQKLEAARRIVKALEGDRQRLSTAIDTLQQEKQRLAEELAEARKAE